MPCIALSPDAPSMHQVLTKRIIKELTKNKKKLVLWVRPLALDEAITEKTSFTIPVEQFFRQVKKLSLQKISFRNMKRRVSNAKISIPLSDVDEEVLLLL